MTENELKGYRQLLGKLQGQLGGKIEDVRGTAIQSGEADSGPADTLTDSADKSVHEYEEQVDRALEESELKILTEVEAALQRIDAGTFGKCVTCARPISQERLQAIPYARQCITCANQPA
jgi:RNA polymerase-binding protein DksA